MVEKYYWSSTNICLIVFLLTNLRLIDINFACDSRVYSCRETTENITENLEFELKLRLSGFKTIKDR